MAPKTILVLGSTGSCGLFFVQHALNKGHHVRAHVRSKEKVTNDQNKYPWAKSDRVELIEGNLLEKEHVSTAVKDVDAIVCMVGPPPNTKEGTLLPTVIRNVCETMREHGVKRLLVQMGAFTNVKGKSLGLVDKGLRKAFTAVTGEEGALKGNDAAAAYLVSEAEDLDWTIMRPAMLNDDPTPKGIIEAAHDYSDEGQPSISPPKIDLTRWYVELLDDTKSFRKAPTIQYVSGREYGFARERVGNNEKRTAVITGGNSGLGFETARRLLLEGMRVVIACRNITKGQAAVEKLLDITSARIDAHEEDVSVMELDVSSISSVRSFAASYIKTGRPIHVLCCNAGIMMCPYSTSVDGIEIQVATNYVGHFELCRCLEDVLVASAPARVVHVSSIAARFGNIDVKKLSVSDSDKYDTQSVYSASKLMQVVHSRALNLRLKGKGVTSNSLEPGVVKTNLSNGIIDPAMKKRLENGVSVEEGAMTHVYLCGSMDMSGNGGGHYEKEKDMSKGANKLKFLAAAHSLRASINDDLWAATVELIDKHAPSS